MNRAALLLVLLFFAVVVSSSGSSSAHAGVVHKRAVIEQGKGQIEMYWSYPDAPGRHPAIVLVHGHQFPGQRIGGKFYVETKLLEQLAGLGYVAVAVSQPGYGASSGPPDFCGPKSVAAVRRALQEVRGKAFVDPARIVHYGRSRGATVASQVALVEPTLAGLALSSGAYDLYSRYSQLRESVLKQNIRRETGGASAQALKARSVMHSGRTIAVPTLIVHGQKDEITPYAHARQLADRLRAARVPVMTRFVPNTAHKLPDEEQYGALYKFLASLKLPAPGTPGR